jgi:mannosyl-3-phosphoglycerate phosphatase
MTSRKKMSRYIVFTDLDGTLLEHRTYSYADALPGLQVLKKEKIPLVFCSSKTRAEQESLRNELGINDPFIVEDGGAIYFEKDYFPFHIESAIDKGRFLVIPLGTPYKKIREILGQISNSLGLSIKGYGDVSAEEVAGITGLSIESASLAKDREYEETILSPLSPGDAQLLKRALIPLGLTLSRGGRFYSVKGQHNKGKAAMKLARLFAKHGQRIITVGIGDSPNDLSMLSVVYVPLLVQRPDKTWQKLSISGVKNVDGIGPVGWTNAMKLLFSNKRSRWIKGDKRVNE